MSIGKLGVWTGADTMTAREVADFARQLESWNYGAFWYPEAHGRDSFVFAAWVLSQTERITLASGIANIYARDAQATHSARLGLNEQSGGRFLLGLGVSHAPLVEGLRGHDYDKPLSFMRHYLEKMREAQYAAPKPEHNNEVVLAALGPKMLELSSSHANGAHPYLVPPEHTRRAREILGPDPKLYVEQKVVLETDPARARAAGREALSIYMKLPNYRKNLLSLGFSDHDMDTMSDGLVDALVAWGDESALRKRVREHWEAGANHVCIQPLRPDGGPGPCLKALEALAPSQEQPST